MDESDEYENRVEEFLQFAQQNEPEMGGVYLCPCVKCLNGQRQSLNDIRTHLGYDGISLTNIKCIWYGKLPQMSTVPPTDAVDVQVGDRIEDKLRDLGQEGFRQAHAPYYEKLEIDSKKPLYMGCTTFTRLSRVLRIYCFSDYMPPMILYCLHCLYLYLSLEIILAMVSVLVQTILGIHPICLTSISHNHALLPPSRLLRAHTLRSPKD